MLPKSDMLGVVLYSILCNQIPKSLLVNLCLSTKDYLNIFSLIKALVKLQASWFKANLRAQA